MELKKELYKGIEITYEVSESGLFTTSALDILISHENPNTGKGWSNIVDAERGIKLKIDKFLGNTPKNYKELADAIGSTLVWTGYEDCHVDESILKVIVENFIRYTNKSK